jgi:hypothetical protein
VLSHCSPALPAAAAPAAAKGAQWQAVATSKPLLIKTSQCTSCLVCCSPTSPLFLLLLLLPGAPPAHTAAQWQAVAADQPLLINQELSAPHGACCCPVHLLSLPLLLLLL